MVRVRLFEILDQAWCPQTVRDGATDCLEVIIGTADSYRPVREQIFAAIRRCGAKRVVDLCSGGGGPWPSRQWRSRLESEPDLAIALTDKFPNSMLRSRLGSSSRLIAIDSPVDATSVPEDLRGFRTIFSSFHHFPDSMAIKILSDAVKSGDGFASAEVTSRSLRALLAMCILPAFIWVLTPWMRPFNWLRLLLTYLIPVIPFVVFSDGVVSCLRTRTPEELLALTRVLPQYEWTAGYAQGAWLAPVYLIGLPGEHAKQKVNGA